MQIRPLALHTPAYKLFPLLLIVLFLCLNTSPLPIRHLKTNTFGIATAAPIPLRKQSTRALTRNSAKTHREIELVSSTSQGVTIQLVIPKSDFLFENGVNDYQSSVDGSRLKEGSIKSDPSLTDNRQLTTDNQSISFPGCNFITELGMPRLPMQSTLMSVPPDVDFQVRVIDKDFSTHTIEATAVPSNTRKDHFFPERLAETGKAGWIRENRVLPIQLNPVQYNPARREVRLYRRLVVEVRFVGNGLPNPPGMSAQGTGEVTSPLLLSTIPSGLYTESAAYDALFADMLVNPQSAMKWRAPRARSPAAPSIPFTGPRYKISITESGMYSITARDLATAGANFKGDSASDIDPDK